ncbi:MAG: serine/threonine protein kinase [Deltaproteobacteria bacterium]|nr:serine/threonine protein kinase [Deltaproteobacteria bacterium]
MLVTHTPHNTTTDPWVGRIIDDRYRVVSPLGQGGMGVIYKVEHVRIGKIAAMKLLRHGLCNEPALLKRFRVEAEAISRLNHPNIVQVFDYGEINKQPYLVMEYLQGEDLGEIIKRDGPIPLKRLIPLLIQICDALTEAHELNIVHRDLKPENIQVSRTRAGLDHIKVLDFGLAKLLGEGTSNTDSAVGTLVGTPYYMAPEQIRGRPIDQRSDIYALGALTYRALTGKHAFTARTPVGVLTKHVTESLVPPSQSAPDLGISMGIDNVVARAMAKAPEDRFNTIAAMKAALLNAANRALSGEVVVATDPAREDTTPTGDGQLQRRRETDAQDDDDPNKRGITRVDSEEASATNSGIPKASGPVDVTPPRLTRADFAFERRLNRGRRVGIFLFVALLLASGGTATWWFYLRERPPKLPSTEIESNNTTATATPLAPGTTVRGKIGRRLSTSQSDLDWYILHVDESQAQALTLTISAIPNVDLVIELYDRLGGRLAMTDGTSIGGAERLFSWPVAPGTYYVLVREVVLRGHVPTENITDTYALNVTWRPLPPYWEREPNDSSRQANRIALDVATRGTLARPDDADTFRLDAPKGPIEGLVSGIPDVDIVVEVLVDGNDTPRTFDSGKKSEGERIFGLKTRGDKPLIVRIRRKFCDKVKSKEVPGQTKPYSIRFWTPR